jgi:hypothetical protein
MFLFYSNCADDRTVLYKTNMFLFGGPMYRNNSVES